MPKNTLTIPALADVTKDISGPLPEGLLDQWAGSGQRSHDAARILLAPYRREGVVVCSDTAGLTRMTQERDLLDVLWLVAGPMQVLFAVGSSVGGRAVGTWEADNTEMLYPADVGADVVVDAMLEAQARIAERTKVRVGLCIHSGVFYEIGGGLFGGDAQLVEELAENDAAGGEILVTDELAKRLPPGNAYTLERRADLDERHAAGVFSLRSERRVPSLREVDAFYPHPFPPAFFAMLQDAERRAAAVSSEAAGAQLEERHVVFVARKGTMRSQNDLAIVLDELLANDAMREIVSEKLGGSGQLVETTGGLAIVVFTSGTEALEYARAIRTAFAQRSLAVSIGIDRGPVLLFEKVAGRSGTCAGDPINLSSKISEDLGEPGRIRMTERATEGIAGLADAERFEALISGVTIRGVIV